jgi:hypothetical protein
MFSSQSFFTGLLALLSLSQTVSSFAFEFPATEVSPDADIALRPTVLTLEHLVPQQDDNRLVQNDTYTFRWIGVINGTLSTE